MIVLREYKNEDLNEIKEILHEDNIKDCTADGIIYVMLDGTKLIGTSKVNFENDKWFLNYLIIKKEERGKKLGDGLLRAILYKLENQNVKKVYFNGENIYLINKGFNMEDNGLLSIDINKFFSKKCNCSGKCNEI